MCGIAGWVGEGPGEERVARMTATLVHRGPDSSGRFAAAGVALGHRRLAVLDPTDAGGQFVPKEGESYLVSPDGTMLIMLARATRPMKDMTFDQILMAAVREAEAGLWDEFTSADPAVRAKLLTSPLLNAIKSAGLLPEISDTEREALAAGDVWFEGELFGGRPDWSR